MGYSSMGPEFTGDSGVGFYLHVVKHVGFFFLFVFGFPKKNLSQVRLSGEYVVKIMYVLRILVWLGKQDSPKAIWICFISSLLCH